MYEIIRYYRQVSSPGMVPVPLDVSTLAWIAAVAADGATVSTARQILVNNLIVGLKVDGVFTKLDRLWLFAGENTVSALTDIVAGQLAKIVGEPAFVADDGYTGDGSTTFIDSNFNASTAPGPDFTLNSGSLFGWNNTLGGGGGAGGIVGTPTAGQNYIHPDSGGNILYALQGITGTVGASGGTGLNLVTIDASTLFIDVNGANVTSTPNTGASVANEDFMACRANGGFSSRQISCFGFGGLLSPTDRVKIYTRIRTYMTGVGVP